MELAEAYSLVASTTKSINGVRGEYKAHVCDVAVQLAHNINVEVTTPRVVGRQVHRANIPASTPEEHYGLNMFLPFVDAMVTELNGRFPESHPALLIPSKRPAI